MGEFIPATTPELESSERHFWDNFIRALEGLSDIPSKSDEMWFDLLEVLQDMEKESKDDALELLFGYTLMFAEGGDDSKGRDEVISFLSENGFVEPEA